MGYGYKSLTASSGVPVSVTYDGHIEWKSGSISIDWSAVAAVSGSDVVLAADQLTVPIGQKYLRYGQILCEITSSGLYGPYDPSASSTGRETLVRGKCGILNQTVLQAGVLGITGRNTDHWNLIEGGRVWFDRILQNNAGTASLAAGPQLAGLLAVLPRLQLRYA